MKLKKIYFLCLYLIISLFLIPKIVIFLMFRENLFSVDFYSLFYLLITIIFIVIFIKLFIFLRFVNHEKGVYKNEIEKKKLFNIAILLFINTFLIFLEELFKILDIFLKSNFYDSKFTILVNNIVKNTGIVNYLTVCICFFMIILIFNFSFKNK